MVLAGRRRCILWLWLGLARRLGLGSRLGLALRLGLGRITGALGCHGAQRLEIDDADDCAVRERGDILDVDDVPAVDVVRLRVLVVCVGDRHSHRAGRGVLGGCVDEVGAVEDPAVFNSTYLAVELLSSGEERKGSHVGKLVVC